MEIILSIKPRFADLIFKGEKKYEFRRSIFKDERVNKVIVYASAPVSKVIGEFEIDGVLNEAIDVLWNTTKDQSGITEEYYQEYFEGKNKGYAIKIKKAKKYKEWMSIEEEFGIRAPQSFAYIKQTRHNKGYDVHAPSSHGA
jgi:predicted transcriptional regulator